MAFLAIISPTTDEVEGPGPLTVTGTVPWAGGPPSPVSIQLDGGPAASAVVGPCSVVRFGGGFCFWSGTVIVPPGLGKHVITATDDRQTAKVGIEVGEGITNTLFTGTCIAKSALSLSSQISSSGAIGLQFLTSPTGSSVKITSFPQITFPTSTVAAGVTSVVTMQLDPSSPVTGIFDSATGTISIPGVILDVTATLSINTGIPVVGTITRTATGKLTVPLTTQSTSSPESPPVFTDTGGSLQLRDKFFWSATEFTRRLMGPPQQSLV
jgi:hypothetical protein